MSDDAGSLVKQFLNVRQSVIERKSIRKSLNVEATAGVDYHNPPGLILRADFGQL